LPGKKFTEKGETGVRTFGKIWSEAGFISVDLTARFEETILQNEWQILQCRE
jgi:hypothetical protein